MGVKNLDFINFIPDYAFIISSVLVKSPVQSILYSSFIQSRGVEQVSLPFSILVAHLQTTLPHSVLLRYEAPQSPHMSKLSRRYLLLYLLPLISTVPSLLQKVYAAVDEQTALYELDAFDVKWSGKNPKIAISWRTNLATYFKYPQEVRTLIYTTNSIENFNRQLRKVTKAKSVFPN